MLVNRGTRCGKEVLAFGFKQNHLGEIIGTQTAGAVLAASAFLMDSGDLLLLAVADVAVDGQRLEGVGVRPTIKVPFDPVGGVNIDTTERTYRNPHPRGAKIQSRRATPLANLYVNFGPPPPIRCEISKV